MQEISATELAQLLESGKVVRLIDVREPWEHNLAKIPNSVSIPLQTIPQRVGDVDPGDGTTVVVYCHHGVRSMQAAMWLQRTAGVSNILNLAGGIHAWSVEVDTSVPIY